MNSLVKKVRINFDGMFGPMPSPDKWVFIVGCYNSGTTLLHNLLASHPMVGSMPYEGQVYTDQLLSPKSVGLPRLWAIKPDLFYMDENSFTDINVPRLKRHWGARFNDPNRPVLIEKSPTNAARVRWLQKHFLNSYFIGIVRNGYAVTEGIRRKAGHPLEVAARQWNDSNEIMLRDFKYLSRHLIITYEDLTENVNRTSTLFFNFLGLDSDIGIVSSRTWQIHEQASTIKNMNERSLAVLTEEEKATIKRIAEPMLMRFNYKATFRDE